VATLARAVATEDEVEAPVDVVFVIVGPRGDPRDMLRLLSRLARLVKQTGFLADLRAAGSPAAMRQAVATAELDAAQA
jgi:mannitol/fructose-specific phosphotransferase system IIA component (Ntr-type)